MQPKFFLSKIHDVLISWRRSLPAIFVKYFFAVLINKLRNKTVSECKASTSCNHFYTNKRILVDPPYCIIE